MTRGYEPQDRNDSTLTGLRLWLRFPPYVVACFGLLATIALWHFLLALEARFVETRFERDVEERRHEIQEEFEGALEVLESLATLRAVNPTLSREAFRMFTTPLLARHRAMQALSWNPVVRAHEREAHEARARSEGLPNYRITELTARGETIPARDRNEYVVACYIEPPEDNEPALGLDVASEPVRLDALWRARDTGELAVTANITLVQEEDERVGFLAIQPVFTGGSRPVTREERRARLEGYMVGVLRIADIVEAALEGLDDVAIGVRLVDETEASTRMLDLHSPDGSSTRITSASTGLVKEHEFPFGGRSWRLSFSPSAEYASTLRTNAPFGALLAGVAITALLTAYLDQLRRRATRVEALIEAREVAETALRASEERHRLTLESIADGGWDWNIRTGELFASANWLRTMGFPQDESDAALMFFRNIHPDDAAAAQAALDRHLEGHTPHYECECRLLAGDGEYHWFLRRGRVVSRTADGTPLRMVGTDTDISSKRRAEEERRDLERQVQHSQKLDSLGVLAGGIAHDFNNLLTGVLGEAELAQDKLASGEPISEELERVRLNATRAAELVRQMLAYAGKGELVTEAVAMAPIFGEMKHLLVASLSKKAVLRSEFEGGALIEGDASQLRQLLMNLLLNASEALGDQAGTITVRARNTTVSRHDLARFAFGAELEPGPYVAFDVSDTGEGMDEETCARIFEPFFSTKFQGRGLGLAVVRGIIARHKGALHVRSVQGGGTTFEVLLPRSSEKQAAPAEPPRPSRRKGSGVVLVADDEVAVRSVAKQMLERAGYVVLTAGDGLEALDVVRNRGDDLVAVLLDLTMPRMGGREAFHRMRDLRGDVPVILASGYNEETTLHDSRGVAGFLQKPYRMANLLAAVELAIDSRGGALESTQGLTDVETYPAVAGSAVREPGAESSSPD